VDTAGKNNLKSVLDWFGLKLVETGLVNPSLVELRDQINHSKPIIKDCFKLFLLLPAE